MYVSSLKKFWTAKIGKQATNKNFFPFLAFYAIKSPVNFIIEHHLTANEIQNRGLSPSSAHGRY